MKRIFVFFSAVFAAVGLVSAAPVSADQVVAAANIWAAENAAFGAGVRAVSAMAVCDTNQARTILWYQVSMTGGGCLIMAPVTEIEPVVAALQDDPGEMPANHPLRGILTADMRNRLRFLGLYAEDRPAPSRRLGMAAPSGKARSAEELTVAGKWGERQNAKWTRLLGRSAALPKALKVDAKKGVVDPVPIEIGIVDGFEKGGRYTHWNQVNAAAGGYCYNYYTPEHAVCGCVATAMSAVMQYFACQGVCKMGESGPEVITDPADAPTSKSCTMNGEKLGVLACIGHEAEEGAGATYEYDWSIFDDFKTLEDYENSSKLTEAHRELLGRVAYNAGVMVNMMWTSKESGAYSSDVVKALRDAFGFTDARFVGGIKQEHYAKLIYQQCWAGRPVIMGIKGHEVVAVGYGKDGDGVDRVRVFLGWGGHSDAWYALPYIETASIPGGSSYLSEIVTDVTTMMAVDGSGTFPVCGHIMPALSVDVECGGQTVKSNQNGYFGLFADPGSTMKITCNGCSTTVKVGEDVKPASGYSYKADELNAAVPGAFMLPLVNFETAVTTPGAQAQALATGKLILAYSDPDSPSGLAVFNVFKKLSEENYCDCTNRYVFIALSYGNYSAFKFNPDSPVTQADYNGTSYGVFDPGVFVPANRWAFTNGRLEYSRVCDYTLDDAGEPVATPETEAVIREMIAHGWEQYLRSRSTITLTVSGDPDEAGEVSPNWGLNVPGCVDGIYNGYTNGETVVFSAPEFVTNETAGVVWKCVGWELFKGNEEAALADGSGIEGSFAAEEDTAYELVWKWEAAKVKVSVEVPYAADGNRKASVTKVETAEETKLAPDADYCWCDAGCEVTFSIESETVPVKYVLDDTVWSLSPETTEFTTDADEDGTFGTITVTAADKPVVITVVPHSSKRVQLTVKSHPASCDFGNPDPAYGVAYHFDNLRSASLASETATADGISWKCIGWELSGASADAGEGPEASFTLNGTSTLTWKWGVDLTAMAPGNWMDDPSTEVLQLLNKLPDDLDIADIEFTNVPAGWEATPRVDESGHLVADLQIKADEWAEEHLGVELAIVNLAGEGEIEVNSSFTVGDGTLTVTVPESYLDEDAGLGYAPYTWVAKDASDMEIASGEGATATFAAADGDVVKLTWTWKAVAARITASINGFVSGTDYSERFSMDGETEQWCDFGDTVEFTVAIDNSPASYKFALKDWDTGASTAYEKDGLTIRVTAKEEDGPVNVTALFDFGKSYAGLAFAADPEDCAYGSPEPAYGTYSEEKMLNNQMLAKIDISVYTNIFTEESAEVTNVWELVGWELRDGNGGVYASGEGSVANFRVMANDSVFVWKWALMPDPTPARGEPVPPLGPGDTSPMVFGEGALNFNIANAVNGWWYGVYTKTDLADSTEEWTYLKGYDPGYPATNLIFSIELDPTEKQRFFKIILTEDEPQSK